jgi:tetratricopeptide (TPR) repeat protein
MTLAILLALAVSACGASYQEANRLFESRRFAEAGEALDRATKEDPNCVPAWTLRGKLAMAFDRFDVARAAFRKAAMLEPESPYTQFMLGFFYYVDNDFTKAIPPLEAAARLNPRDPRPLLYLAMSQEGLAHPDLALAIYQKTIAMETGAGKPNAETHTAYGRLLFTLGRTDESAAEVARVLQIDPQSRDGHYEAGKLAFEKGDPGRAAAEGEQALSVAGAGTTDRQIHFLLARAYAKLGKTDLAESHRKQFEASPMTLRR